MWSLAPDDAAELRVLVAGQVGARGLDRIGAMLAHLADTTRDDAGPRAQRPACLYLPGLATQPFHDPAAIPSLARLSASWRDVLGELQAVIGDTRAMEGYLTSSGPDARPHAGWNAFFFCHDGAWRRDRLDRCPRTAWALEPVPFGPGDVMFSVLDPGAEIPPHHGNANFTLTVHLGLVVPQGAGLAVADEERTWRAGELLVFDDTFRHAAWNRGASARAVLLFDVWHPDLTLVERAALRVLLPELRRRRVRAPALRP